MPIDKSWIYIKNRLSDEYWKGLRGFIEYAKNFANSAGHISCPCKRCLNKKMLSVEEVDKHIFRNGFDVTYTKWVFHGEMPGTPLLNNLVVASESDDEMAAILNDVAGAADFQYKSKTNSQNRQTNEDINFHGRRSYTQIRYDKMDLQTGELYSAIDNWGDQHTRGGKWSSTEQAKQKHSMMVEERQTQMLEFASVNEKGILNKNMKKRRGRQSGVGLTLPKSAFRRSNGVESAAGTSSTPLEVHAHIQRLETTVTRLMDALQRFIPGLQLDQSNDPSSSSSAAHNHDDEDAIDLQD